jgi:S-adenosylmethionine-dependent methyltransferase
VESPVQDRNFDDIAEKFSRNIYGTTKGQLRQAILWQDLEPLLAQLGPGRCGCWMPAAAKGKRP